MMGAVPECRLGEWDLLGSAGTSTRLPPAPPPPLRPPPQRTRRHSESPGPMVTATASSWSGLTPAAWSAASTQPSMAAWCASCASLGTTPPQAAWMSACPARASPSTRPLVLTTATPVSSQLLSMPRMRAGRPRSGGAACGAACCCWACSAGGGLAAAAAGVAPAACCRAPGRCGARAARARSPVSSRWCTSTLPRPANTSMAKRGAWPAFR